ncbi:Pre-mRNA-splicing factor Syf1-like protein [Aduncisulcus paluster]|uniref:Pre-mRNA-splicing factor Syf1-like protein n=1 Tax=Aduncisulcus paluster TaxID=2918883 RepID=A0ABQ5KG62_9EUKA|nr:Pre-mRNA-splicing factor Syf1-like protein [Aduncisulcus paluster]
MKLYHILRSEGKGVYNDKCEGVLKCLTHDFPTFATGWLEYARVLASRGDNHGVLHLLMEATIHCKYNDSIIIRAISAADKINNISIARSIISTCVHWPIEKLWKIFIEGANLELKYGHPHASRRILRYLIAHYPRCGPAYVDAVRVEEEHGSIDDAIMLVQEGLSNNPKYSPLWVVCMKLFTKVFHVQGHIHVLRSVIALCQREGPSEVLWKMYFILGESLWESDSAVLREDAMFCWKKAFQCCVDGLKWKVLLLQARYIMKDPRGLQDIHTSLTLAAQAVKLSGRRSFHPCVVGLMRLYECAGMVDDSFSICEAATHSKDNTEFEQKKAEYFRTTSSIAHAADALFSPMLDVGAKQDFKINWKMVLEKVLLCRRQCKLDIALKITRSHALSQNGRLWAVRISLMQPHGEREHVVAASEGVRTCPKSGEAWVEMARVRMNPLYSSCFSLDEAAKALEYAMLFTEQYGDVFIELLRLYTIRYGRCPDKTLIDSVCGMVSAAKPNYGRCWQFCKLHPDETCVDTLMNGLYAIVEGVVVYKFLYIYAQRRRRALVEVEKRLGNGINEYPSTEAAARACGIHLPKRLPNNPEYLSRIGGVFAFNTALSRLDVRLSALDEGERLRRILDGDGGYLNQINGI